MAKPPFKSSKKIAWAVIVVLILLSLGLILFWLKTTQSSTVNFQTYEPRYLPDGISIVSRSIGVWGTGIPFRDYRNLNFEFNNPHFSLVEEKDIGFAYDCGHLIVANASTCTIEETPGNQRYQLLTTIDPTTHEIWSQRAAWLRGKTHIWIEVNNVKPLGSYTREIWGNIIDSFVPFTDDNIAVKHIPYESD